MIYLEYIPYDSLPLLFIGVSVWAIAVKFFNNQEDK